MANYKVVDGDQLDAGLKAVGDAIRTKNGTSENYPFPGDAMPNAILSIEGGKEEQAKSVTITESGTVTVTPDEGKTLSSVEITVAVESGSSADVRYVTFRNESTGEEFVKAVATGDDCVDVVAKGLWATPTKESDAQYHYTYYGWGAEPGGAADDTILQNITENKTVYAIFSKTLRTYTITYLDDDGTTVLNTQTLAYGTVPSYTPAKDGYLFAGWDKELATVTGDATYTATWTEVIGGSCGDNASWMFDASTGALTIYGTGDVTSVGWQDYRSAVTSVSIEDGITSIPGYAFYGSGFSNIEIPDSVISIGKSAFNSCASLSNVTIGANVASIGNNAFGECTSLTSVEIPNSVTSIGDYIFNGCTGLESVTLGDGITIVPSTSKGWFNGCTSLTEIRVNESNPNYCNDEHGVVFNKAMTTLIIAPRGISGTYTIPDGVTNIEDYSFYQCTGLTASPLRSGITRVGEQAFYGCTGITSIVIYSSITTLGPQNHASSGITSVTMQVTSGWWYNSTTENGAKEGNIPESQFTNASTCRNMFKTLGYCYYWWHRT